MRLISAILLNPFWRLSPALPSILMARFRRFSISLRNLHVRDFIPKMDDAKNEKLKIFLFGVPHPLDFSNGKVRPSCYFGKSRTSVYEWRPHNKNSKTFLPWLQAPIKILSGKKPSKATTRFFVSRMRNAEACITENHHELARGEKSKKGIWKGGKNGDFWGVFPCIYY